MNAIRKGVSLINMISLIASKCRINVKRLIQCSSKDGWKGKVIAVHQSLLAGNKQMESSSKNFSSV